MSMEDAKFHANITAKYSDSNSEIKFSDFKSKKKGSTWTQLSGGLLVLAYQRLTNDKVLEYWAKGIVEKEITHLRKIYVETNGKMGISKTDAIRVYKVIFEKLHENEYKNGFTSFDNFTLRDLGLEKKEWKSNGVIE